MSPMVCVFLYQAATYGRRTLSISEQEDIDVKNNWKLCKVCARCYRIDIEKHKKNPSTKAVEIYYRIDIE